MDKYSDPSYLPAMPAKPLKSIYCDPVFASYWNDRAGLSGELYKQHVLDPIMFRWLGSIQGKTVLELGPGNGYLVQKFFRSGAKQLILADISPFNLQFASKRAPKGKEIQLINQDMTRRWKLPSSTTDVIYSNMMLNEVSNIRTPVKEAFRALKKNGKFIFSVTHPAWDLWVYAQERAGLPSKKITGLGNYFDRRLAKYIMGADSKSNTEKAASYGQEFEVSHFHWTVADYVSATLEAGFTLKKMIEPEINSRLLKANPRFAEYRDFPVSLVIAAEK